MIATENTRPQTLSTHYNGRVRRAAVQVMNRRIYRAADLCAANSKDGVAEIVQCYGADPSRVRRIPNLVQPERLIECAAVDGSTKPCKPPSICVISRLDPLKRLDTLLDAAAGLSTLDWRIDVVGDGPERAPLQARATHRGIGGRVHFHGWQSNPYSFMARATAVVNCSTLEGFSNTVLESMALSVPVITSLCSSDAEEMCHIGAALGFKVGDSTGLRLQLNRLIADKGLANQLAETAWRYAQRHTVRLAIFEYEDLVNDAIAELHRRRRKMTRI